MANLIKMYKRTLAKLAEWWRTGTAKGHGCPTDLPVLSLSTNINPKGKLIVTFAATYVSKGNVFCEVTVCEGLVFLTSIQLQAITLSLNTKIKLKIGIENVRTYCRH